MANYALTNNLQFSNVSEIQLRISLHIPYNKANRS